MDEEEAQQSGTPSSFPYFTMLKSILLAAMLLPVFGGRLFAQTVNATQQLVLQGLRTNGNYGSFAAAAYGPDGSLYLLLDEHDGIRVLKTNGAATTVLAQAKNGAVGDAGVAMAVDASGNVYVTGTTTSGMLAGTKGSAFASVADGSTNSFLARYDASLNLVFLSFLGAGRTAATSVAATADSAFVTGITFNAAFPVTAAGIQQAPASGSSENGFVERFSSDGSTLEYATYLTGAGGNTMPAIVAADQNDDAYVTGSTTASGFPTIAALQPEILLSSGVTSAGFLTKLNPAGSAFVFSTFVAGSGMTGMALDKTSSSLLLTGSVALGQFPVATVAMSLAGTGGAPDYQTLLRVPEDGQSVTQSALLTSATTSYVTAGGNGDAWVSGAIGTPLFPGITEPDYAAGDSYLLHVRADGGIDQTLRFGGQPKNNVGYASLASVVAAAAVSGTTVSLPGTITATVSASLQGAQAFELPMVQTPNAVLPNTLRDVVPSAACGSSSVCTGSGAMLAQVATSAGASLAVSSDDLPNVTVRNVGSVTVSGLAVTATGYSLATDCGTSLAVSGLCHVALTGSGPGTLTVSASNAATATVALAATTVVADALVLSTDELDFGIVSAAGGTAAQTVMVTNLSGQSQTFGSARDGATTAYGLAEVASTCVAGATTGTHVLAAGASCGITLGLTASSAGANDGAIRSAWKIATRDVIVTGYAQAAALSVSATEVDFGTLIAGGLKTPRYLYLSNNSNAAVAHAAAALPASSPFTVIDGCPGMLAAKSVCQMVLGYQPGSATETDSAVLTLDAGISVLLTGEALPAATVTGTAVNPSLSVSATQLSFATAVAVTDVSGMTLPLTITNTGTSAFGLVTEATGDFGYSAGCPATLGAGASCTLLVSFAPSQPGARQGLLSVTAGNGYAPQYVALSGTGTGILPANNGVLDLGQTLVGEPVVVWYKVQQALPSLTAAINGGAFGVALVADTGTGHGTLPASSFGSTATLACGNCWLGLQYLSQTAQTASAVLTLMTVTGGSPYVLSVTAVSEPVEGLVLTPGTLDFGSVMMGSTSEPMTFTLADLLSSGTAVSVQSVSATGDFAVATNTNGGASCGGTLAATASCFVSVGFTPTAQGDRSGTLTIMTTGGTVTAALSGYGTANPGLQVSPSGLTFANLPGAPATMQTVTLTNRGVATMTVGSVSASDASFAVSTNCSVLTVGASCTVTIGFTAQDALVEGTLTIPVAMTVNGQALNTTYAVTLAGAYTTQDAGLEILPGKVNYGASATGTVGGTRLFTLNNLTGKALNVTLEMAREFPLAANGACAMLAAGGSCSFPVSFAPVTNGAQTGTISVQGVSADGLTSAQVFGYLEGYGTGAGALRIAGGTIPYTPLMFGQVTSGQSVQQRLSVTNTGGVPLTIRRVSSAPPFLSTSDCGASMAAGASCAITVTYAPTYELATGSTASGTRNDAGSLSIESDAATSPDFVAMSGLALPVLSATPASGVVLATYSLSNGALTFSNTQVGDASSSQVVTLTNTGTSAIHVTSVIAPVDFTESSTCGTLQPGDACAVSIAFVPGSASSAAVRTGAVELQSDATDSLEYVSVVGSSTASPLVFGQSTLSFGSVNLGSTGTLSVSVANESGTAVTFTGLSANGPFTVAQGTCPAIGSTLAAGSSCTLVVTFAPVAGGVQTGTLSLSSDATQLPLTVALNGTATVAKLQVTPGALSYSSIAVRASSNLSVTLTNVGTATLTGIANALSGTNAVEFAVTVPCSTTQLLAGQSCMETVIFTPAAAGARVATLSVASSDPNGPTLVPLSGTGVAAGTFVLTVNGGNSATATVAAGSPATYALTVTPLNGYAGSVALTCSALIPGKYASCSLLNPLLTLGGATGTTVTISTVSAALQRGVGAAAVAMLMLPSFWRRKRARAWLAMLLSAVCFSVLACGKGTPTPVATGNTVNTPAGTYSYQVTASSTSGTQISSTVTLNLIVQ